MNGHKRIKYNMLNYCSVLNEKHFQCSGKSTTTLMKKVIERTPSMQYTVETH